MNIVALSGGIGGAKLANGLNEIVAGDQLSVIVNTGDDFEHLGLHICPDIDTMIYTLAGVNNPVTGWGRDGESWSFMSALAELAGADWFQLGDKDLAQNVLRTSKLSSGATLSEVTAYLAKQFSLKASIVPMTDDKVRTMVATSLGTMEFQHYFVRSQCEPLVRSIYFENAEKASPAPAFAEILESDSIDAFVICPSNPYLSIDPILSVPGVREGLQNNKAPVIAVSPIVSGDSLKGPTSKIMSELGIECSATQIARHYTNLIDTLIIDSRDEALQKPIESLGIRAVVADIEMQNKHDQCKLADRVVQEAKSP